MNEGGVVDGDADEGGIGGCSRSALRVRKGDNQVHAGRWEK